MDPSIFLFFSVDFNRQCQKLVKYYKKCYRAGKYLRISMVDLLKKSFALCSYSATRWNTAMYMFQSVEAAKKPLKHMLIVESEDGIQLISYILLNN